MAKIERVTVIAPDTNAEIETKYFGYRAADVFFGYLDPQSKEPQIRIISGRLGSLATAETQSYARESIDTIAGILQEEFKLDKDSILRCDDGNLSECIIQGGKGTPIRRGKGTPGFHTGLNGTTRIMALVGDEAGLSQARTVLEKQKVSTREFDVRPPMFGKHSTEGLPMHPPIDIRSYDLPEEALLATGDE